MNRKPVTSPSRFNGPDIEQEHVDSALWACVQLLHGQVTRLQSEIAVLKPVSVVAHRRKARAKAQKLRAPLRTGYIA